MYCKLTDICVYVCMYCINTVIDKACEEEYVRLCINYILAITRMYIRKTSKYLAIYCLVL